MAYSNLTNDFKYSGMTGPLPCERRKAAKSPFRASAMPLRHLLKGERL